MATQESNERKRSLTAPLIQAYAAIPAAHASFCGREKEAGD
jgi:hypothetical protein